MRRAETIAIVGIVVAIALYFVFLLSPRGVPDCPIPPTSIGTCSTLSGSASATCYGATTVICATSPLSWPYVLVPLAIVIGVSSALTFALSGKSHI